MERQSLGQILVILIWIWFCDLMIWFWFDDDFDFVIVCWSSIQPTPNSIFYTHHYHYRGIFQFQPQSITIHVNNGLIWVIDGDEVIIMKIAWCGWNLINLINQHSKSVILACSSVGITPHRGQSLTPIARKIPTWDMVWWVIIYMVKWDIPEWVGEGIVVGLWL